MNVRIARIGIVLNLIAVASSVWMRPAPPMRAADQVKQADNAGVRALQQQRLEVLKQIVQLNHQAYRTGNREFDSVARAHMAMLEAELELAADQKKRLEVLEATLQLGKQLQEMTDV